MPNPTREMDLSTFLLSLGTTALVQLGEAPEPETDTVLPPDLDGARQTIDVLEILAHKCRGNLDEAEDRLLKNLLHDLRRRLAARRG